MNWLILIFLVGRLPGLCLNLGSWRVLSFSLGFLYLFLSSNYFHYVLISEWFGFDEISILMIILTFLVLVSCLVRRCKDFKSRKEISERNSLEIGERVLAICLRRMLFFYVRNWIDFYFFFEASLMPTFWLIIKWGYQPERLQAGLFIIIYTVSASIPLLIGLGGVWWGLGTDNMVLCKIVGGFSGFNLKRGWLLFCLGFLVKLPVYFVHGWLPKAHVEAPLRGSMLLAGVLLKFGGYGIIRFVWFSEVSLIKIIVLVTSLGVWGGVIRSIICVCQSDLKSFIAYSSIGHIAIRLGAILRAYSLGKISCVCLFFAHGLCSPALFSIAARVYDFKLSRNVVIRKGILRVFPKFSLFWFLFCVLNMGMPPSLNFCSEVFCVSSMFWFRPIFVILIGAICFMAGCYCLILYSLVNHGALRDWTKSHYTVGDRYLYVLAFLSIYLLRGVFYLDFFFV